MLGSKSTAVQKFGNSTKFHLENIQKNLSGSAIHQVPMKASSTSKKITRLAPKGARIATNEAQPIQRVMKSKVIQPKVGKLVFDSSEKDDLESPLPPSPSVQTLKDAGKLHCVYFNLKEATCIVMKMCMPLNDPNSSTE